MSLSLAQLLTPVTEDQVLELMLGLLRSANFPVLSWAPKAVIRRVLMAVARAGSSLSKLIPLLARSGFGALAQGDWLDLYMEDFYGIKRDPAVFTIGEHILTDTGGVGPLTFTAEQLWSISGNGKRYRNTTGGVLPANGSLTLDFQAESPGADYNVANGDITELVTPIPGVSIANPAIGLTGTWITQQGVNEESDADYYARGQGQWAKEGVGGNEDLYKVNTRDAAPAVTRVKPLEATPVAGDATLVLAGPDGPASLADVAAVQAWFDGIEHHVLCTHQIVVAAIAHPLTISGTVNVKAKDLDAARAGWISAFTAYRQTLDIGATVYFDKLVQLLMDQTGVQNITGLLPASDVVLAATEIAVFTDSLVWNPI
jgi:uncharacterized phage protein gp47/JayE